MEHKWVKYYSLISEALRTLYTTHKEDTGKKLFQLCMQDVNNFLYFNPWAEKFTSGNGIHSFDPIHIFASFNSWEIKEDIRYKKIRFYYKVLTGNELPKNLSENSIALNVFKYFPHVQITRVVGMRSINEQNLVWDFFYEITNPDLNFKNIETYFMHILQYKKQEPTNIYGVRLPILTIFMFWVNSSHFLPLDKNTRKLIYGQNRDFADIMLWDEYYELLQNNINQTGNLYRNLTLLALQINRDSLPSLVSSAIQKCTKTQSKYVPLRNTYLAEISNNPASRFCFSL